jgi:hypothetical protein
MKHNPYHEQHTSDDRCPPLALGRHSDAARELPRNSQEQEHDACNHQDGRDWRIL